MIQHKQARQLYATTHDSRLYINVHIHIKNFFLCIVICIYMHGVRCGLQVPVTWLQSGVAFACWPETDHVGSDRPVVKWDELTACSHRLRRRPIKTSLHPFPISCGVLVSDESQPRVSEWHSWPRLSVHLLDKHRLKVRACAYCYHPRMFSVACRVCMSVCTQCLRKGSTKPVAITALWNLNGFSKFLHRWRAKEISSTKIRKTFHRTLFMLSHDWKSLFKNA